MELLVVVVLSLHLLCVNVASGGPLICVWLEWKAGRGDELAAVVGRRLAMASFLLLIVGGLVGLLLGLLIWSDDYASATRSLFGKVFFGVWEYVFSLVLMAVHAIWWKRSAASGFAPRVMRCFLLVLAGTNLLYHFPFLFVILSDVANHQIVREGQIDAAAFRGLMIQGDVLARALHFMLACFAVTGVAMLHIARKLSLGDGEKAGSDAQRAAVWGGLVALVATLLQLPIGLWLITKLPRVAMLSLMGGDLLATLLLGLSILLALWLMHQLSAVSMGKSEPREWKRAAATMVLVVVLMTGVLQRIKQPARVDKPPVANGSTPQAYP